MFLTIPSSMSVTWVLVVLFLWGSALPFIPRVPTTTQTNLTFSINVYAVMACASSCNYTMIGEAIPDSSASDNTVSVVYVVSSNYSESTTTTRTFVELKFLMLCLLCATAIPKPTSFQKHCLE